MSKIDMSGAYSHEGGVNRTEARLLNYFSGLQNTWNIVLGDNTACELVLVHEMQKRIPSLYLHFQCGQELLKIGLDDLGILWLHPILRNVSYGSEIPDTFVLPILKEIVSPLEKQLQHILHTSVIFLGYFNGLEEKNISTLHFMLCNQYLLECKRKVGLNPECAHITVQIPTGNTMLALLAYLHNFPKNEDAQLDMTPIELWVRAGYSFFTLEQIESFKVGNILIPDDYHINRYKAALVFLDQELPCTVEKGLIKVSNFQGLGIIPKKSVDSLSFESSKNISISHMKKRLFMFGSFDIAKDTVSLKELPKIKPGYTLKIDSINQAVTLRIQEKSVAIGEPIIISNMVGIKIVKLL